MKAPGLLLSLLTFWWSIPFFILALLNHPLGEHIKSFIPFFLIFAVTILLGMLLSTLGFFQKRWKNSSKVGKYFLLCIAYLANGFIVGFLINYLRGRGLVEYFGSDPEGSILMMFPPTILGYFLIGLGFVFVSDWVKFFYYRRKGIKGPEAEGLTPGDGSEETPQHSSGYDHSKGMVIGALIGFALGFLIGVIINPPFSGIAQTSSDIQGLVYFSWFALGIAGLILGSVIGTFNFWKVFSRKTGRI
jgi:hypothetical protein